MRPANRIALGLVLMCSSIAPTLAQPLDNPRRLEAAGVVEFVGPLATTIRIDGRDYRMGDQVRPCRIGARTAGSDEAPQLQRGQRVSFSVSDTPAANPDQQVIDQICIIEGER
ncbi:hypothetical protein TspCOW1_17480 [Thiohalobacter sp. COW1]|uniref:P pilus assembly protein, porin PapC n=1 Tax=Thiohalobacter thiocyanaticus TaxID=585455 RepID=A0A1Z4VP92_9GAMM|nr:MULTISPECIES: hypothetical protein [Thiohalobacter]BAZ93313.1 P pilus assembly protein, porin PapC [Thiohalobacter thiocyanaticus]BCO31645.1 hypothetical protein TspCOW1_17480 [Thiohalobacter sp. COW1]